MSGYTPDQKLRFEQITKLRRQWLKDQELSPREPVVQAKPPGPVAKFWAGFLEPKSLWRVYVSSRTQLIRRPLIMTFTAGIKPSVLSATSSVSLRTRARVAVYC